MTIVTTQAIEGRKIKRYCGIVSGEAVVPGNILKDALANVTDVVGGRSAAFGAPIQKAKEAAMKDMVDVALAAQASAVLNVRLDSKVVGGVLMVCATGTAVLMEGELH